MVVEDANSVMHIFQIVHYRHLLHQHNTGNVIKLSGWARSSKGVLLHVSAYFFLSQISTSYCLNAFFL